MWEKEVLKVWTILVTDNKEVSETFVAVSKNVKEVEKLKVFTCEKDTIKYIEKNHVDFVIIDMNLYDEKAIHLGKMCQIIRPHIMISYICNGDKRILDAIKLHVAGFLLTPYTEDDIRYLADSARFLSRRYRKRIFVRTFGYFDIFVDGEPIMFKSAKAKELLALLIERRGGTVTTEQIIGTLWEDRPNDVHTQNLCSKVVKTLEKELKQHEIEDILISSRGIKRVDIEKFDCDLYAFLDGSRRAATYFIGEYMLQYSWAESRMGLLNKYKAE